MNVIRNQFSDFLSEPDALLMDVARRIQLTPTKHAAAEQNFKALCSYIDRSGSPLQGRVIECYPSGSFATGTAILSRVKKDQHDVDVVVELNVSAHDDPKIVLQNTFHAINGEPGGRYYGKVTQNSRCVTVEYDDKSKVDLMPVARLPGEPDRAAHLFHYKKETGETYHKVVNPWGFADYFNRLVEYDPNFYDQFTGRRMLVEGQLKADNQPLPAHAPIEEKSARVVALQLIKRARDVSYRMLARKELRKPPSVVLAAVALEAGNVKPSLIEEVINIAHTLRGRLGERNSARGTVEVLNPSYLADQFTDRWPEDFAAQSLFDSDLRRLIVELKKLRNGDLSIQEKAGLLQTLFGETAANSAINDHLKAQSHEMEASKLRFGSGGRLLNAGAAATTMRTTAIRPATREGGGSLPE